MSAAGNRSNQAGERRMIRLELERHQILGHRRAVGHLDARLPSGEGSLRKAAWVGLQDSVPRAALLSINARVERTEPITWEDPSLVQLWGPRFSAYVVAARDHAVFSLGRLPDDRRGLERARSLAARLQGLLGSEPMTYRDAGRALGVPPNQLRYAATTGTVLMRWEGAGRPTIWTVPAPEIDPEDARRELARRFLHVLGPATAAGFAGWAGVKARRAVATFEALRESLTPVRVPHGDAWILARDEPRFRAAAGPMAAARLLPSGDPHYLCWGADRELLVPDRDHRARLWTSRVWPGALLVAGEIAGTWRRSQGEVTIEPWRRLSHRERDSIEDEARSLPVPGVNGRIMVRWGA
jgi:hypothetical protein